MTSPIVIDLFAGGVCGWGKACQECQDEPHDCEECVGFAFAHREVADGN